MIREQTGQEISQQDQKEEQVTELSLEETFGQIEDVIAHLETEEITLEQSFQEYNRGMKLLQHCNETIDRVEKKVLQINEDGGLDEF
ncbi:MAG: exodeoxyribonuclease VII small subunit [Eubacterium sp.]|nr:exodeoxyribonuclease VII small subunit [Eubacterium sp.]